MSGSLNVGLVTRTDADYVYVWSASHRTTEAKIPKCDSADALPGDVVQYHQSGNLKEPQTDAKLTRVQNHDLSVLYHPKNPSYFRIKTTLLTPEKGIYDEDYDPAMVRSEDVLVKFFAFSIEFGKVASFVDLEHSPGKVYRGYITRLPIDGSLTEDLNTIFGIVDMELKEVTDPYAVMDAKKHAPWHDKLVHLSRALSADPQQSPPNFNDMPFMCDPALVCEDERVSTTRLGQREVLPPAVEGRSSYLIFDDPSSRNPPQPTGILFHDGPSNQLSAASASRNSSEQSSRMLFPPISNCSNKNSSSSSTVSNNANCSRVSSDDEYSTMLFGGVKVNENGNATRRDFLTASDLYKALHSSKGEPDSAVNNLVWDEDDENKRKKHVSWGGTEYNIFDDIDSIDQNDCLSSTTSAKTPTPNSLTTDLLDLRQVSDDNSRKTFPSNNLLDLSKEISTQLRLKTAEAMSDYVPLNVHKGIRPTYDEASQILIIGRNKNMSSLAFRGELESKLSKIGVDERIFNAAVNHIKFYGPTTIPIYLHMVKMISVSDEPTVRNSSSYASAIYRELMDINVEKGIHSLNIILYTEHKNMLANVSSAALCFPLHPNVFPSLKPHFQQVVIEVVVTDERTNLSDDDVKFLQEMVSLVRKCNTTASMASEELNAQWRDIWFTI